MKKALTLLSIIVLVSLVGCTQKQVMATPTVPVVPTTTTDTSIITGTSSFNVDTRIDFSGHVLVNSVYSKQVAVNISNTGENTINEVDLTVNGLADGWTCVGTPLSVALNSGEAVPYMITLSSKDPIVDNAILNFTVMLTTITNTEVQHTLECYGEIVVSK